jgi:hypothetical protein
MSEYGDTDEQLAAAADAADSTRDRVRIRLPANIHAAAESFHLRPNPAKRAPKCALMEFYW